MQRAMQPDPAGTIRRNASRFRLTPRQTDIALAMQAGATTTSALASRLGLAEQTVCNHISVMLSQTRTRNRRALVERLLRADDRPAQAPTHGQLWR